MLLLSKGLSPYYAEACPAVLTSLYVGGEHVRPHTAFDSRRTDNVVIVSFKLWSYLIMDREI